VETCLLQIERQTAAHQGIIINQQNMFCHTMNYIPVDKQWVNRKQRR
jgi:hypothetical protein